MALFDGTFKVNELPVVVWVMFPSAVIVGLLEGNTTVLPPLILKLFPANVKVGFGTDTVKLFPDVELVAIP